MVPWELFYLYIIYMYKLDFMRKIEIHARMYHQQQNKCYSQKYLLAYFEATVDF